MKYLFIKNGLNFRSLSENVTKKIRKNIKIGNNEIIFILSNDTSWNDFDFHNLFRVFLYMKEGGELKIIKIGSVKFADPSLYGVSGYHSIDFPFSEDFRREDLKDSTPFLGKISLGQDRNYYHQLMDIGPERCKIYLQDLNDIVYKNVPEEYYSKHKSSLLRWESAIEAKFAALDIINDSLPEFEEAFITINCPGGNIEFRPTENLEIRHCSLIGYNGAGKTRLLSDLALYLYERMENNNVDLNQNWNFTDSTKFNKVISVSFSPFDTFKRPKYPSESYYSYIGIRDTQKNISATSENIDHLISEVNKSFSILADSGKLSDLDKTSAVDDHRSLIKKLNHYNDVYLHDNFEHGIFSDTDDFNVYCSIADMIDEFNTLISYFSISENKLEKNQERDISVINGIIEILTKEYSFRCLGFPKLQIENLELLKNIFLECSSGHKIILLSLFKLVKNIKPRSLILIDEPENHLHPSLLSVYIQSINYLLSKYRSFAIFSTHSPIVLQETPSSNVRVVYSGEGDRKLKLLDLESFGENLGLLIRTVFHLDSEDTDFRKTLRRLSTSGEGNIEALEEKYFPQGLGTLAASFLLSDFNEGA